MRIRRIRRSEWGSEWIDTLRGEPEVLHPIQVRLIAWINRREKIKRGELKGPGWQHRWPVKAVRRRVGWF